VPDWVFYIVRQRGTRLVFSEITGQGIALIPEGLSRLFSDPPSELLVAAGQAG
jgi:hypothetical protein